MGEEVNAVIHKSDTSAAYKLLFGAAFGEEKITGEKITKALTQFVASLVSAGSKYDLVKKDRNPLTHLSKADTICSGVNVPYATQNHCLLNRPPIPW
jgi:cytochrome c peroxidase